MIIKKIKKVSEEEVEEQKTICERCGNNMVFLKKTNNGNEFKCHVCGKNLANM